MTLAPHGYGAAPEQRLPGWLGGGCGRASCPSLPAWGTTSIVRACGYVACEASLALLPYPQLYSYWAAIAIRQNERAPILRPRPVVRELSHALSARSAPVSGPPGEAQPSRGGGPRGALRARSTSRGHGWFPVCSRRPPHRPRSASRH